MQNIVLFMKPDESAYETPLKIGNLIMNRFAVDEDAAFEILKIYELEKYSNVYDEQKGMDLIIKIDYLVSFRIMKRKLNNPV